MSDLTRDEILNMEAGREMDALVGKDVMLLDVRQVPADENNREWMDDREWIFGGEYYYISEKFRRLELPHYSTDIAAAWQVVEKMGEKPAAEWYIESSVKDGVLTWWVMYEPDGKAETFSLLTECSSFPLVICRVALLLAVTE